MRRTRKRIGNLDVGVSLIMLLLIYSYADSIIKFCHKVCKVCFELVFIGVGFYTLFIFVKWLYYTYRWRYTDYTCFDITRKVRNMSPREFEIFIANLFNQLGYDAHATVETCDGGKDVIATNKEDIIYIECKHWNTNHVIGREILQKLVGSAVGDNATRAIVVTTSKYNNNAYEYAKKVPWLELWTIKDIIKAMNKVDDTKKGYILNCLEG